jgi:hypothetical protein
MYVKPEAAITVYELLMMRDLSLETCSAIIKHWNNKFYYRAASCWLFLYNFQDKILFEIPFSLFSLLDLTFLTTACPVIQYLNKSQSWWYIHKVQQFISKDLRLKTVCSSERFCVPSPSAQLTVVKLC